MRKFYEEGEHRQVIEGLAASFAPGLFQHEYAYASLAIHNWQDAESSVLATPVAGYDQAHQAQHLQRLIDILKSLMGK